MKNKKSFIIIVLILLILAGISLYMILNKNEGNNNKPTSTATTTTKVVKKLSIVNEESKSRPFAVMINNVSQARSLQSGLQDSYIVYEMIVEGGITRYLALFLDQDTSRIGSIRSARHYYLDYALENDAIYVHHGQSPQAESDFKSLKIDRIVASENSTGWREKGLGVAWEHTLFTSIDKIKNGIGKKRTERNKDLLLNYSVDEIDLSTYEGSIKADDVNIPYSDNTKSSYKYDSTNKYYLRFINKKEHKDYVSKKQYHFKNIITYKVKNYDLNDGSGKGRQGFDNVGNGKGYYISNGYAVPITWEKTSRSSQTVYKFLDGKEIKVNDGNTFIQIQPTSQELTIS